MGVRAKKYFKMTSSEPIVQIQSNFTEMFLIVLSTKIAQTYLHYWLKWQSEVKVRDILQTTSPPEPPIQIQKKYRNVPHDMLYQKRLDSAAPLKKMPNSQVVLK